jgi:hypothetical protein
MGVLIVFLALYALVTGWFFIALMRWTLRSERGGCACRGSLGNGQIAFTHADKMCYPAVEGLHPLTR